MPVFAKLSFAMSIFSVFFYWMGGISRYAGILACAMVILGGLLNKAVELANGGRMPVKMPENALHYQYRCKEMSARGEHIPMTEETRLRFLSDVLCVRAGHGVEIFYSIGDVLVIIGKTAFILTFAWSTIVLAYRVYAYIYAAL